jgi:hypothetical protein
MGDRYGMSDLIDTREGVVRYTGVTGGGVTAIEIKLQTIET